MTCNVAHGFTKEQPEAAPPRVLAAGPLAGNEPKGGKTMPVLPGTRVPPACKGDGAGDEAGAYMESRVAVVGGAVTAGNC